MSYEIVYERQFIKLNLPDNKGYSIIPLCLHGSNNCTEMTYSGRERRVRDWGGLYFNGYNQIPLETPERILEKVEDCCGGEYQQHFKRNGNWVDDEGLRRFFKNGIKDAKTLEELNEMSRYSIELRCCLSVWLGSENHSELVQTVHNSKELYQFLLDAKARIKNRETKEHIYVCIGFTGDKAVPYPKEEVKYQRKPKEFENEYWVLRSTVHGAVYAEKLTSRNLSYTYSKERARKFSTEKEAIKWVETKIRPRFTKGVVESLKPEKVEIK